MRLRSDKFYVIRCQRNGDVQTVDIDNSSSQEVVNMFCDLFKDRLEPSKDKNGKYKKGLPFTKIIILEHDKKKKQIKKLTHCNVYNLSPTQVKERIVSAIKSE